MLPHGGGSGHSPKAFAVETRKISRDAKNKNGGTPSKCSWILKYCAVALFLLLAPALYAQQQWSVGYYIQWGNPVIPVNAVEWDGLTHVIASAAMVNSDGSIDMNAQAVNTYAAALVSTAHANGVKALISLQGNNNFQPAITNNLSGFVSNIMNIVNTYGFDGVDLDWEGSGPSVAGSAMQQLAAALRAQLGTRLLTSAVVVTDASFWGTVHSYFDRIQIMTYDLSGTYNPFSWYNSALYTPPCDCVWSVDRTVSRYLSAGVPASKLSIGMPFYGTFGPAAGFTRRNRLGQVLRPSPRLIFKTYCHTQREHS